MSVELSKRNYISELLQKDYPLKPKLRSKSVHVKDSETWKS